MRGKSELSWTNITRDICGSVAQEAWDKFVHAKEELEAALEMEAQAQGAAQESDSFKFSYRSIGQGAIGMAIDAPAKAQAKGFGGLQRPKDQRAVEAERFADWQERQRQSGRRF